MTIATVGTLVETLRQTRWLDAQQMDKLTRKLQHRHSDPRDLAKDLVRRGWLTPQQINQLFTGRLPQAVAVTGGIPQAVAVPAYGAAPAAIPVVAPPARRRGRSRSRWLFLNLLGVLVIVGLATLLYYAYVKNSGASIYPDEQSQEEKERTAEVDLVGLRNRINEKIEDHARLRRDLLDFRQKHAGTAQVAVAGELMAQLSSPLDQLSRSQIDSDERYEDMPAAVVAVLGESRSRHWGPARGVVFSPDGKRYISAGDDRKVRVWGLESNKEVVALSAGNEAILYLGFTDRGKSVLVATADGKVTIWDGSTGEAQSFQGPVKSPSAMAVMSTVRIAASASDDGKIVLWDLAGSKTRATITGHTGRVNALAFSANGLYLASAGADRSVRLHDVSRGETVRLLEAHKQGVRCVGFAPDTKLLASGSDDADVIVWDVNNGQRKITLLEHEVSVTSVAFAPDNQHLAAGGADGSVRYFDIDQERALATSRGHTGAVWSVAYSIDGKTVASAASDGTVRMWGAEKGEKNSFLGNQEGPLTSVAINSECTLIATASRDKSLVLWDIATRMPKQSIRTFKEGVSAVAFSPLGQRLAAGDQQRLVRIYEMPGIVEKGSLSGHPGPIASLAFSSDDKSLAIGSGYESGGQTVGQVRVVDLAMQEERFAQVSHPSGVASVAIAPSNKAVAGGYWDGTIKLWDLAKGNELASLANGFGIAALAFTPDGKTLAVAGSGDHIKLWDVTAQKVRQEIPTKADVALALAVSPDGKKMVSTHYDGWVIVWDAATGQRLEGWQLPGPVNGVTFAADSRHVATANGNSTVYVFRLASFEPKKKETGTGRTTRP